MMTLQLKNKKIEYIAIICSVISLVHCLYYVVRTMAVEPFCYDELNYIACAKRIIETGTFSFWGGAPDAYVSPAFPLFLALNFLIFGSEMKGIIAIRIIQSFLISAGVYFSCKVAYKLSGSKLAEICSGLFIALNASFSYYATLLLTEPLCFFFTMAFINLFLDVLENPDKIRLYLTGMLYAAAILTRPPIAVLIPVFLFFMYRKIKPKEILYFGIGLVTLILPWTIRNLIVLKKLVFFSTQTNAFFWGFCKDPTALGLQDPGTIVGNLKLIASFFKEDPVGMLQYMTVEKFRAIFLNYEEITVNLVRFASLDYLIRIFFVGFGFVGVMFGLFTKKYRKVSVTILIFLFSTFLVIPTVRYGFPFYPFLGMFTGVVLDILAEKAKEI